MHANFAFSGRQHGAEALFLLYNALPYPYPFSFYP